MSLCSFLLFNIKLAEVKIVVIPIMMMLLMFVYHCCDFYQSRFCYQSVRRRRTISNRIITFILKACEKINDFFDNYARTLKELASLILQLFLQRRRKKETEKLKKVGNEINDLPLQFIQSLQAAWRGRIKKFFPREFKNFQITSLDCVDLSLGSSLKNLIAVAMIR